MGTHSRQPVKWAWERGFASWEWTESGGLGRWDREGAIVKTEGRGADHLNIDRLSNAQAITFSLAP